MTPFLPFLMIKGKRLIKSIPKLKPWSEFQSEIISKGKENVLIIGESTVAGVGASSVQDTIFGNILKVQANKYNIYNIGKVGLKAAYLTNFKQKNNAKLPINYKTTVILIGANDCFAFTNPNTFLSGINIFITEMNAEYVYICSIPPVHEFPAIPKLMRFFLKNQRNLLTRQLQQIEKHHPNLHVINLPLQANPDFFSKDGIHPSDLAYEMMTSAIWTKTESVGEKGDQN
ncbi:SGNH/GDSL hydrolase family protein [Belliella sp. DSM 111904]|uniref:SGNH/GDSL hydrolase family protein n=1 Tax=Belliella filtrata TaxID=2923435 RepID=A0ABS9UVN8_9BACT|nr:SGNH/GDSL hydrolase family protein [Belliella filtrata]MCH7408224.1 SGNH/GDSL hydrolase family protein [Belliella filtrata]